MSYNAGTAFMQIVPSFAGVVRRMEEEATKDGKQFANAFRKALGLGTEDAEVGPSDASAADQGESAGGRFADGFKARVDAALRALPSADVNLDDREAEAKLSELRVRLETLSNAHVGVDVSDEEALTAIELVKGELDTLAHDNPHIRVRVDAGAASAELATVTAEADAAGGASSGGGLSGLANAAAGMESPMGGLAMGIGSVGTALIPIAGLAAGAASTLPAILAGAGTGMGALYLGFHGLTTAVKAYSAAQNTVGLTTAQVAARQRTLANTMAGLSGPAQTFVKFIGGTMLPMFHQWQTAVQGALLPALTAAAKTLMPMFKAIEPFIVTAAKGIGNFAQMLSTMLTQTPRMANLNTIFKAGASFMTQLGEAAVTVLTAIIIIGAQATPILAAMGTEITTLAGQFANWVAGGGFTKFVQWIMANGQKIVTDLIEMSGALLQIVVNLEPFGMTVLNMLPYLTGLLDFLTKSPALLSAVALGIGAVTLALIIMSDSNPIGLIVTALGLLFVGLVELISNWTAAWGTIAAIVTTAWTWLNTNIVQPILTFFETTLPNALHTVAGAFTSVWATITSTLTAAWQTIYAVCFGPIVGFFRTTLPAAITAAVGFFTALPSRVTGALSTLWGAITGAFGDVGGWVTTNIVSPVVGFFQGIPASIGSALSGIAHTIEQPFISAWNGIAHAWNATVGAISFTIPSWVPGIGGDHFGAPHMPTFRATGGPVSAGSPYVVGERGPELFIPNAPGVIVPHQTTMRMATTGGAPAAGGLSSSDLARLADVLASRPSVVQLDTQVLATSVQEYGNWRRQHGDPAFAGV